MKTIKERTKLSPQLCLTLALLAMLVCWLSLVKGRSVFSLAGVAAKRAQAAGQGDKKARAANKNKKLPKVPTQAGPGQIVDETAAGGKLAKSAKGANAPPSRAVLERKFDELLVKAREKGTVRVIIGFRAQFQPEGDLSARAVRTQRAALARAGDALLRRLTGYDPASVKRVATIPFLALELSASGLEQIRNDEAVVSIQEDVAVPPSLAESTRIVGATAAWANGASGLGRAVAILDTGVDKTHSFLAGKVVSEACYSTTNSSGSVRSVCPGGVSESTATGAGINCAANINGCAHGTHVAGIAAGRGTSFSGVARDANLIAIQVFSRFDSAADCGSTPAPCARTYQSDYIKGLERVLALRSSFSIAAVNMSLGGGKFTAACDSERPASLFFVSPAQVNYLLPAGLAGTATVSLLRDGSVLGAGQLQAARVAPGLFAANANGQGVATATVLRVKANGAQSFEPVARLDTAQNRFVALPIDLGVATDRVFLILFGTGFRGRSALSAVTAGIGGTSTPVSFVGAQGSLVGLDQINLGPLPRSLVGRGLANIALTVDGKAANAVDVSIR